MKLSVFVTPDQSIYVQYSPDSYFVLKPDKLLVGYTSVYEFPSKIFDKVQVGGAEQQAFPQDIAILMAALHSGLSRQLCIL